MLFCANQCSLQHKHNKGPLHGHSHPAAAARAGAPDSVQLAHCTGIHILPPPRERGLPILCSSRSFRGVSTLSRSGMSLK